MEQYPNRAGDSGVTGYELGNDYIDVKFTGGRIYRYTYRSAGERTVEIMKRLAIKGKGLSGYISRFVREKFERIWLDGGNLSAG